jgi:hypothetical protein
MQQNNSSIPESLTSKEVKITDTKGRVILLKKPSNVLSQYRLVEMVGASAAKNDIYMSMILPFIYIVSIDNLPVSINSKIELDALISRFDDDDIRLIGEAISKNFSVNEEEEKEKIKK